jgi:hypothetical protein
MVINNRDDVKTVKGDFKITRDQKRLLTVHQDKDYRIVFDKIQHVQQVITQNSVQLRIVYLPTVSSTSRKGQLYDIFRAGAIRPYVK